MLYAYGGGELMHPQGLASHRGPLDELGMPPSATTCRHCISCRVSNFPEGQRFHRIY